MPVYSLTMQIIYSKRKNIRINSILKEKRITEMREQKYYEPTHNALLRECLIKDNFDLVISQKDLIYLVFKYLQRQKPDEYIAKDNEALEIWHKSIQSSVAKAADKLSGDGDGRFIKVANGKYKLNVELARKKFISKVIFTQITFLKTEVFVVSPSVFAIAVSNDSIYYAQALLKQYFRKEDIFDIHDCYDKLFFFISDSVTYDRVKKEVSELIIKGSETPSVMEEDEELDALIDSYLESHGFTKRETSEEDNQT